MIKLAAYERSWTSPTYTHTDSQGGTPYDLQHNFGRQPDAYFVQIWYLNNWHVMPDIYARYSDDYGSYIMGGTQMTANNTKIMVTRTYGGTQSIRFKLVWFD